MKTFTAFTDKATALLYEPLSSIDQWMTVPASGGCNCKSWSGWLSNITEHAAERYVKSGGNLIRQKPAEEVVIKTDFEKIINQAKNTNDGDSI